MPVRIVCCRTHPDKAMGIHIRRHTARVSWRLRGLRFFRILAALMVFLSAEQLMAQPAAEEPKFSIEGFLVEGNSLLLEEDVQETLEPITGKDRGAEDVEKSCTEIYN